MTKDELAESITNAIQQLGFARIAKPALLDVFTPDEQASFAIQDKLEGFATNHGWTTQHEGTDFVLFHPASATEPPRH
jgi:hypothetical protein